MLRSKVFWSDIERETLAKSAVELQMKDPDLEGLALLRAAIKSLPASRQRKVVAISQVPWFLRMVRVETERQKASEGIAPAVQQLVALGNDSLVLQKSWRNSQLGILSKLLDEVRQLRTEVSQRL